MVCTFMQRRKLGMIGVIGTLLTDKIYDPHPPFSLMKRRFFITDPRTKLFSPKIRLSWVTTQQSHLDAALSAWFS